MTDDFCSEIRRKYPQFYSKMVGYSDDEIEKIEKLYGVEVTGQLRQFLRCAGRSAGGLVGDDTITLYRNAWTVRSHVALGFRLINDLQDISAWEYISNPFPFSIIGETQYYYVRTGSKSHNKDIVYHYNEDESSVESTNMTLFDFLRRIINAQGVDENRIVCRGELLIL